MTWASFQAVAPEIAAYAEQRLQATRVMLLGTLRRDGSPRISPVEPCLARGHLLFGAMSWSRKADDVRREPRCVLHTAVTAPDAGEGECRLYGRAVEVDAALRQVCPAAWWAGGPPAAAAVFELSIEQATWIDWDLERGQMTVRSWSVGQGGSTTRRSYP